MGATSQDTAVPVGTRASGASMSAAARPALALVWVIGGATLILLYAVDIATAFAQLSGEGAANMTLAFRASIPIAIILLALVGMALFGQRARRGRAAPMVTAAAFPSAVLMLAAMLAAAAAIGSVTWPTREPPAGTGAYLLGMLLFLGQVAGEELLLRGLLQPVLIKAWGALTGLVATAFAFAAVHYAGGWRDPVSLLNIFLGGIWFGLLALRTGGLGAPILAHFGYNWSEEMLFGVSPNPGSGPYGSILDMDLVGPTLWGGSVDGFNASLLLSLALLLFIAALAFPYRSGRTGTEGGARQAR